MFSWCANFSVNCHYPLQDSTCSRASTSATPTTLCFKINLFLWTVFEKFITTSFIPTQKSTPPNLQNSVFSCCGIARFTAVRDPTVKSLEMIIWWSNNNQPLSVCTFPCLSVFLFSFDFSVFLVFCLSVCLSVFLNDGGGRWRQGVREGRVRATVSPKLPAMHHTSTFSASTLL